MLSPELLKKIEHIYIRGRFLANDVFAGEYESAFRGRGMEFEEVREYIPGDDVRTIDWNVTARMEHPFVKVFREEREQTLMLLVDVSSSQNFGSRGRLKKEVIAEIAGLLAFAATRSNDKVGLLLFSDRVEKYIPPKKGRSHVWRVISEIMTYVPKGRGTDLTGSLQFLNKVLSRKAICFVISDFMATGFDKALKVSSFKHDVIPLHVLDDMEIEVKDGGIAFFEDLESGTVIERDLGSVLFRRTYAIQQNKEIQKRRTKFQALNLDSVFVRTSEDYVETLLKFFRRREKKI